MYYSPESSGLCVVQGVGIYAFCVLVGLFCVLVGLFCVLCKGWAFKPFGTATCEKD